MLRSTSELKEFSIMATDGEMGNVEDLYFDEDSWIIRYLVVDVGNWLSSERVLLVPEVVTEVDPDEMTISVGLSQEEVENSPGADAKLPVSRAKEIELHRYHSWRPYWERDAYSLAGMGTKTAVLFPTQRSTTVNKTVENVLEHATEYSDRLRSADEVTGYKIQALDGGIGHIEDLIVDERLWLIRYALVDTRNWLPGKKVLLLPRWIRDIHWAGSDVHVDLTRESIENSPEYDPGVFEGNGEKRPVY